MLMVTVILLVIFLLNFSLPSPTGAAIKTPEVYLCYQNYSRSGQSLTLNLRVENLKKYEVRKELSIICRSSEAESEFETNISLLPEEEKELEVTLSPCIPGDILVRCEGCVTLFRNNRLSICE